MAGSQISTSVSIIDNLKGYLALSLTEYTTSAAAAIAAGSVVEIAGAFFTFAGDETPNASSWTAISTGSTAYLALTASGTAGSQIVNAAYTATAPTWRDDLQGWYASAASSVRIVASVYKAESTSYYPKYVLKTRQSNTIKSEPFLSVASSLSVGGVASVASSFSVNGLFYPTGIVPISNIQGDSVTRGSVFAALNSYIPTTSNTILVSGGFTTGVEIFVLSYAVRVSSTQIDVYSAGNSSTGAISFSSGSGSTCKICMAW